MLKKLLPHGAIILSGMYLVFYCIDRVNPAMAFIDNSITKVLLLLLCAIAVIEGVLIMRDERKKERRRQEKLRRAQQARKG